MVRRLSTNDLPPIHQRDDQILFVAEGHLEKINPKGLGGVDPNWNEHRACANDLPSHSEIIRYIQQPLLVRNA
jgi:hypothetical protein